MTGSLFLVYGSWFLHSVQLLRQIIDGSIGERFIPDFT
jgi:hypothetical protein